MNRIFALMVTAAAIVLACLFGFTLSNSQSTPFPHGIRITLYSGPSFDTAYMGIHPLATKGEDRQLGESDWPPTPPVPGPICVINEAYNVTLSMDLHPTPGNRPLPDTFKLSCVLDYWHPGVSTISWSASKLRELADSAIFKEGATFLANMLTDSVVTIDSSDVEVVRFRIFLTWKAITIAGFPDAATPGPRFALHQNYPNPFNPSTVISYTLPHEASVHLALFNTLGQEVRVLASGMQEPGEKSVTFDASGLPSGVYFCRFQAVPHARPAESFNEMRKLLLMR